MAGCSVKVQVTLLMAVLVVMVATISVVTVDARLDLSEILDSFGIETDTYESPDEYGARAPCCDRCICTRSIPPQCRCRDIKTTCYEGCQRCQCTRSRPPRCSCNDVRSFCFKRCSSTTAEN